MNKRKVWHILDFIRDQGKLPTDAWGETLEVDELIAWFGLPEQLSLEERRFIEVELAAMAEAERTLDALRMSEQLRCDGQS